VSPDWWDRNVGLSIWSTENPSMYGDSYLINIQVSTSWRDAYIPDGGTVKFYADGKLLGSLPTQGCPSNCGTANWGFGPMYGGPVLNDGSHNITAVFEGGDCGTFGNPISGYFHACFAKARGTVAEVVNPYSTTTTLTSSPNPSTYGQPVTWTATVTSTSGLVPTGKVKFAGLGGAATLNSNGVATFTKTWLNAGTYAAEAEYLGDDEWSAPSTSPTLSQVVNPALTTTGVASSANPSTQGQSVAFAATVTTSTGVNSAGTVTFTAGGTTLGTATLSANVASFSTNALPVGTTVVQATYNGETNFTGSSGTVTQTINP
jgi:hypothetical protein